MKKLLSMISKNLTLTYKMKLKTDKMLLIR